MRLLLAALTLLLGLGGGLLAHEWYPPRCCSDRDCRELTEAEIPQTIRPNADGTWHLMKWDRDVKHDGYSPDGKYHICELASTYFCLFIPLPSGS